MANRPTAHKGAGGSGGATQTPGAYIIPVRRARIPLPAANDNRAPLRRRLLRAAVTAAVLAAAAGIAVSVF